MDNMKKILQVINIQSNENGHGNKWGNIGIHVWIREQTIIWFVRF